jgi:uncharacterized protein with NRDE domain
MQYINKRGYRSLVYRCGVILRGCIGTFAEAPRCASFVLIYDQPQIMCSVVLLLRPEHDWPLILAANRDEMRARPWKPPARHWPDRENVVAGLDELAGGSWLGLNDAGVLAAVMNRVGSLGPAPDRRSRGELVLEALDHDAARDAAEALAELDPAAYRSFNLVIADRYEAFWLRNLGGNGEGNIDVAKIPPGVSMLTASDLNDPESARIRTYLPKFRDARPPDPDADDWAAWAQLLADRGDGNIERAMNVNSEIGFGTVSSALIALPSDTREDQKPIWRFAAGAPDKVPFESVAL